MIPHLGQGGSERQILELCRRLPDRFEPVLCLYQDRVHYTDDLPPGQPRHVLGVRRMGPRGMWRFVRVLRRERPDILHTYREKTGVWARVAAHFARPPVVVAGYRNLSFDRITLILEPYLSRRSDCVLANSEGVRRELVERARVPPDRIQVIHNFVDLARWRAPSEAERRAARASHGLGPDDFAFVLPGRIGRQKNQIGLCEAIAALRGRGARDDRVRVLLAGRDRDRAVVAELPRRMAELGVTDCVRRLGPVTDMVPLYHAADALVLPSLYEGLPNAALEAHASGLPAIVSAAANVDGIVAHERTGFEIPTGDTAALADAMSRTLGLSVEERRAMGARGRARIVERFHPDRVLGELVELYDRLLARKGLASPRSSPAETP